MISAAEALQVIPVMGGLSDFDTVAIVYDGPEETFSPLLLLAYRSILASGRNKTLRMDRIAEEFWARKCAHDSRHVSLDSAYAIPRTPLYQETCAFREWNSMNFDCSWTHRLVPMGDI